VTVVIGIGNPDRGDDGVGRVLARRLRALATPGIEVRECDGEATGLMAAWEGAEEVVLVDACRGAGAPGTVHRLDSDALGSLESLRHASTHSFGVAAAVGLSRVLGCLPPRLTIYAIEGHCFREGGGLSPEADRGANEVAALFVR
jgi:hydrogenase maturation protease